MLTSMWCGKKERNGREEDDGKFNYLHRVCLLPSHYLFCLRSAFDFQLFKHHQICIDVVLWVLYQYLTEESKVDLRENNTQRMKVRKCCDAAKHINLCIERESIFGLFDIADRIVSPLHQHKSRCDRTTDRIMFWNKNNVSAIKCVSSAREPPHTPSNPQKRTPERTLSTKIYRPPIIKFLTSVVVVFDSCLVSGAWWLSGSNAKLEIFIK